MAGMGGSKRTKLSWIRLLSKERQGGSSAIDENQLKPDWLFTSRLDSERDGDRILFSTPTRRLGDKTQVFPLEKNESVRNRLTHSHEVAALARSIGTHIMYSNHGQKIVRETGYPEGPAADEVRRAVPAILGAIGLAHDIGNPPFGHQGEEAIRSWIAKQKDNLFRMPSRKDKTEDDKTRRPDLLRVKEEMKADFFNFEGNAQTLRILARLQVVKDEFGLNLTYGTLAASMKYTVDAARVEGRKATNAFDQETRLLRV